MTARQLEFFAMKGLLPRFACIIALYCCDNPTEVKQKAEENSYLRLGKRIFLHLDFAMFEQKSSSLYREFGNTDFIAKLY